MSKYGVTPDIVCLAKALGGGMPLGAFVSSGRIMECISHDPALGHITTFGGHPVCCAAGLAAMEYIIDEGLLGSVERKGRFSRRCWAVTPPWRASVAAVCCWLWSSARAGNSTG